MGIKEVFGNICFACFIISIILGLIITILNIPVWNDCHGPHLNECEDAHKLNKSYYYCSGFIGEPRQEDFDIFCAFHPEEGCEQIPHGCVLRENEFLIGFRIPFTKLEWIFA